MSACSKKRGSTDVYEQHDRQLAFFLINFDVWIAGAGGYVPVDVSYVIAELILPHLAERHAPALECAVIASGKKIARKPSSLDFDLADFLDQLFHFTRRSPGEGGFMPRFKVYLNTVEESILLGPDTRVLPSRAQLKIPPAIS